MYNIKVTLSDTGEYSIQSSDWNEDGQETVNSYIEDGHEDSAE